MDSKSINVHVAINSTVFKYKITKDTLAEDIVIQCCKALKIGPVYRHLYALKFSNRYEFVSPAVRLFESEVLNFDFRLRYKLPPNKSLENIDKQSYNYYFHQVRGDVMDNKIPDISYDKNKDELVGLGVTDMYRVMLETGVTRDVVENDYKKYIPKEVRKHHYFLVKKPIRNSLTSIIKGKTHNVAYVVDAYLKKFEDMAPNYLCEEYKMVMDDAGTERHVILKVDPYHKEHPGVRYCYEGKSQSHHLFSIEDLCYISVRADSTAEISRMTGIPLYLRFYSILSLASFISLLDGYYRNSEKWTFNLCRDLPTPSLEKLYAMKCHGPVGGEFAYAKLAEKGYDKPGSFILRESETAYDTYYIDVCVNSSSKPTTYKVEKKEKQGYLFSYDMKIYPSIIDMISSVRESESMLFLQQCIPPSEYDKSPLLLCKADAVIENVDTSSIMGEGFTGFPYCIDTKQLQIYRGRKMESHSKMTLVYRGVWKYQKTKKMDVALKVLETDHKENRLPEFLELAGKWAFVESAAVVKLLGVTLMAPVSMVTEYFPLGNLDEYLRGKPGQLKQVDLVEAAVCLATAVFYLNVKGIVHGNIRCRKLLVANHTDSTFSVRLADPGLPNTPYTNDDIHWIAVEWQNCETKEGARRCRFAEMWAMGTTLWEIYSYGKSPKIDSPDSPNAFYALGGRLPKPEACPDNLYAIILSCWDHVPYRRRKPQETLRDINRILYQVFNSRRTHTYSTVTHLDSNKEVVNVIDSSTVTDDLSSIVSISAGSPKRGGEMDCWMGGGLVNQNNSWGNENDWLLTESTGTRLDMSPDMSAIFSQIDLRTATTSLDGVTSLQDILELDGEYNVILQGKIGQGFYGEVFIGSMEQLDNEGEAQQVAVKKLKSSSMASNIEDFLREINIMQRLKHPNIVEIKGVIQEPEVSLVMEFVQHGSLQCYLKIHREDLNPFTNLLKFALDVAQGMEYLGEKNIVHRDLAARNILVANEMHVKISDFGLAQHMGSENYYILQTHRELPIKWYAPESLENGKFSTRSDVWSYGVTLFEMFSYGEDPKLNYGNSSDGASNELDQSALLSALEKGVRLPCPDKCPQGIYVDLIFPCWSYNSHLRQTFAEICDKIVQIQDKNTNLIQLSSGS